MLSFDEVKERAKKSVPQTGTGTSKSRSWEELKDGARKNLASSNRNAQRDISNWFTTAQQLSQNAYQRYSAEGYKTPDRAIEVEIGRSLNKAGEIKSLLSANREKYADYDAITKSLDDTVAYLQAMQEGVKGSNDYYSLWEDEEAYIRGASEARGERQQRYEENLKKIEELRRQRGLIPTGAVYNPDSSVPMPAFDPSQAAASKIDAQIKALETENELYKQGEGGYIGKKIDDHSKTTQNADFAMRSANRDYKIPTREELDVYDTLIDDATWNYDENDVLRDIYGNKIEQDDSGKLINPKAHDYAVADRLGVFLNATEKDFEELEGTIVNGTWANIMGEGIDGGWKYLKPDELEIYYYYLDESQEKADQYLADMKTELNRRQMLDKAGQWQKTYDESGFWGKLGMNLMSVPAQFVSGTIGAVVNAGDMILGKDINPYSYAHSGMHYSQLVRSNTAQELDKSGFEIPVIDYSLGDIYQVGMSRLDSALATGIGGKMGTLLLGMGAAQNETYRLYQQGASAEQATLGGLAAGAAEMLFEYASFDKLINMKSSDTVGKWVKNALIQGGVEASEEGFTEISNILTNALIMGQQSDLAELYKENEEGAWQTFLGLVKQTTQSAFGGFLGGVGAGTVQAGKSYIASQVDFSNIGEAVMASEGAAQRLTALGNELDGISPYGLGKQAQAVARKATERNTGRLLRDINRTVNEQNGKDLSARLTEKGFDADRAQKIAEAVITARADSNSLTQEQVSILGEINGDDTVTQMVAEVLDAEDSAAYQRSARLQDVLFGALEETTDTGGTGGTANSLEAFAQEKAEAEIAREGKSQYMDEQILTTEGRIIRGDKLVDIEDIETAGSGKVTLKMTDGSTADPSELEFPDTGEAELWRVIGKYAEDRESARALLEEYQNGNLDAYKYARGVEEGFLYGLLNMSPSEMERTGSYVNLLDPMQRNMAYKQGQIAGQRKAQARKTAVSEHNPKHRRKGAVHYGYEGAKLDKSKLNKAQKVGVDFAERLARKKGMTFYFYRSYENGEGERVFKNAEGEIVPAEKNGWYDPSDGSIHIDLNCGDMGSTVLFTIAHELTHFIKDMSAENYRILCGILTEGFLKQGQSVDRLVKNKMEEYRKRNVDLNYEEAFDEVMASSMEGVLSDGRVMDLLDAAETKSKPLWEQLKSFLEDIAILIRDTIEAYRNVEPESPEGRMVLRMEELQTQIQDIFAAGLHEGGENYREGGKMNTAQEGGVKMQLRNANGKDVVWIERNLLKENTNNDPTHQFVADYIATHIGDVYTIIESGQKVYIGQDLPGEYTQSKYTQKVLKNNPNIIRAKNRASTGLGEMIEIATDRKWEKTNHTDNKDAKYGMYRYKTRFGFPIKDNSGKVVGANVYTAELLIRNASDGKKYLYDIVEIKKDTASSSWLGQKAASAAGKPAGQKGNVSTSSIRNPEQKVNKNSLRYQKNEVAQAHLQEQNTSMTEDVEGLNQLVAAQRQRGREAQIRHGALDAAASNLIKLAGARGNKTELMDLLNDFYQYVGNGAELTWDGLREQAMPAVRWLMKHVVRSKQRSEYAQDILNTLRGSRISLDDIQKGEVAHLYGSFGAYRNTVMGSIILANDGISLDSQWQEWAELYPDIFDAETNAADMPEELADIIYRMRNDNTSELEYEYNREFIEQDLVNRVYDSYWNASTLYSVADHYEKQIKQLKAKHRQRINAIYQRHRAAEAELQRIYQQRQEAAKNHYEELYQRREAEYRESRQKAVERHNQAEMRGKLKRTVRDLWKLQERAPKDRRTKEELREFVANAIKAADLIWLERYDEYDMVRNGVGIDLRGNEARLLQECKELLERHLEITEADVDTQWDIEAALQKAKDKAALDKELSKRMKILRDAGVFASEFDRIHKMDAGQLLDDLINSYEKLKGTDSPYLQGAYQEVLPIKLNDIKEKIGAKPVRNMTLQELEKLYEAYSAVLHVVRNANKVFADNRAAEVTAMGTEAVAELESFKQKKWSRMVIETLRKTAWNNLTPSYAFRLIGSGTMERLYKNMVKGMTTYGRDIAEAKEHWQQAAKKYGSNSWDMTKRMPFLDKSGKEFTLSLGQLMSLYALSRRQQALGHLDIGGIMLDSEEAYVENVMDRVLPKVFTSADRFRLDKKALEGICSKLTAEQKAFVEMTQAYLSEVMSEKGNEVSLKLYGIKLFKEKIYFPLRTASQERYVSTELIDQHKLKNSGFTKETDPDANNAVILSDYSHVWTGHVKQMSLYHGMTLPMEDMDRLLNFGKTLVKDKNGDILKDENGNALETYAPDSVCITLQNIFGKHPESYIREMMKQLNGGVRSDTAEDIPNRMLSRFKKAQTAGSLSVWIQQWTSVFRAMAHIPIKYFFQKPMGRQRAAIVAEMKERCPIAIIKEMGGFDTGIGNSEHDYITMAEPKGVKEKWEEFLKHPVKRMDEVTSWLPARADETTWAHIWTAVKRETRDKHPSLKMGTDEFYEVASERFTEVINLTQVYDSVLSKSALMRSKGVMAKMVTQFLAEPTLALNMAIDAGVQHARTGKVQTGTALALIGSIVANAMSSALIYAMRDDDEEETFLEKYSTALTRELVDGINPLTYIPIIRDLWSALQGYDVKRSDMALWGELVSAVEKVVRKYEDTSTTDKEMAEAWAGVADFALAMFGVPAKNYRRDLRAMGNLWRTLEADRAYRDTTANSIIDANQDAFWSSVPLMRLIKGETKAEKLLGALEAGDRKYANRIRSTYKTESTANSAVVRAIKERFTDGKLTEAQTIQYLTKYAGKTTDAARDYLAKWKAQEEDE